MITILIRELLDGMKSTRFMLLLVFSMTVFAVNGVIYVRKIEFLESSYSKLTASKYPYPSTVFTALYQPLSILMFAAEGGDKYLPHEFTVHPGGRISPESYSIPQFNYMMPDAPDFDWAFIIKIIFSLYVLLMGYDAVSGEKSLGTLRLTLSNPVNRPRVLTAKYLSTIITVLIPLLAGILISLMIMEPSLHVISFDTVSRILFLLLSTGIYVSLFAFLSLLVSSLISSSSTGLLILLSLWMGFLIIPEMSGVVTHGVSKTEGNYQTARRINAELENESKNLRMLQNRVSRGEYRSEEELVKDGLHMLNTTQRLMDEIIKQGELNEQHLAAISRKMARFSPMAALQNTIESGAGTGYPQRERFMENMKSYSLLYDRYVKGKTGKLVIPERFSRGWYVNFQGKFILIKAPEPENYTGDTSDFPKFVPAKPSLARILHDSLPDFSMLIIWNLVLAMGAFLAFNRADVR
jgi:ABC-type transport system involved in multi-copper enzyme maturation permease subunit